MAACRTTSTSARRRARWALGLPGLVALAGIVAAPGLVGRASAATSGGSGPALPAPAGGYWLVDGSGNVAAAGAVPYAGTQAAAPPAAPVVALAPTPDGAGSWVASADGGVTAHGDARYYGSMSGTRLNKPIVTAAATPDGAGYWLIASDGGVFSFGDARFFGSTGAIRLNKPIMAAAATSDGAGYWLIASDGGVFTFGDARFFGSTGGIRLAQPVTGAATTPDSRGYWVVTSAGRVYPFGDAAGYGDLTGGPVPTVGALPASSPAPAAGPVVGMAATSDGAGYWLATASGQVIGFGDASLGGGAAAATTAAPTTSDPGLGPVVAVAAPGPPPAASRAVQWALAQVGKPYVYGGTGPDGFDCSGLVMESYASVGVTLPRVAQDQYDAGPAVPAGAPLAPGDVVFFGTPQAITHDGIYIGGGMMVDAPHTGADVRVEPYQWSDYVGATRPVASALPVTTGSG